MTVPGRLNTFYPKLMNELIRQTKNREDVEILALFDNKGRTIGQARNDLLYLAQGQYLTYIDDDDTISETYIIDVIEAIDKNHEADQLLFNISFDQNGRKWKQFMPCIKQIWRTSLARLVKFPEANYAEDTDWAKIANTIVRNRVKINKTIYYYIYRTETSESKWVEIWDREHNNQGEK